MALKSTVLIRRLSTSCNVAFTFLFIIIHIIENLSAWGIFPQDLIIQFFTYYYTCFDTEQSRPLWLKQRVKWSLTASCLGSGISGRTKKSCT